MYVLKEITDNTYKYIWRNCSDIRQTVHLLKECNTKSMHDYSHSTLILNRKDTTLGSPICYPSWMVPQVRHIHKMSLGSGKKRVVEIIKWNKISLMERHNICHCCYPILSVP